MGELKDHAALIVAFLSVVSAVATVANVIVSLRLANLHSKMKADMGALEVALLKQFVQWKDDVLAAINGKYVSAALIVEIKESIGREIAQICARLDHMDERCDKRHAHLVSITPKQ